MNLTIIHITLALTVMSNQQSIVKTIPWQNTCAVYIEYENLDGGLNGFRFFCRSNAVRIRTVYINSYTDVRLQISLQSGTAVLFNKKVPGILSKKVTFPVGVKRRLLFFWRELASGEVELAGYVDGALVAHRVMRTSRPLNLWTDPTRIGARDLKPVEPTFPMQHHVGGIIHKFVVVAGK